MDNENMEQMTPERDDDIILPEGYKEGDTFFGDPDEPEGFAEEESTAEESVPAEEEQPAEDKPTAEAGTDAEDPAAEESAPAEEEPQVRTFKITDGGQEIELKEDDVLDLRRRAQERDDFDNRLRSMRKDVEEANRIAQGLGFKDFTEMIAKAQKTYRDAEIRQLVEKGMSEDEAKEIADQRAEAKIRARREEEEKQAAPARDFRRELDELVQHRPDLQKELANGGKLPREVVLACVKDGVSLRAAFAEYELKEARAEADKIRQETAILKKNAENAAKAPVKGTAGGGASKQAVRDPFLEGFNKE